MGKENIYSFHNIFPDELPLFGYKIHLSATIKNYKEISEIVRPFLDKNLIAYKYIKKQKDIIDNFSVKETPAESGKYITIYPKNHQNFLDLLEQLYYLIPIEYDAIYIMNDRPYRDSKVIFYRFGTIKLDVKHMEEGIPTLIGPDQEKWQDFQKSYYDLPSWIEDIQPENLIQESYLSRNYLVTSILADNNGGNVYSGRSLKCGNSVVIKESRPNIIYFDNVYKSDLRKIEYEHSKNIKKYIAKPIEHVKEWINDYYVYEEIKGEDFYEYAKKLTIFSYSSLSEHSKKLNLHKFRQFFSLIIRVLYMVRYFHERDIVLHDIHPNNIRVGEDSELYFVDLEHVYNYKENPLVGIYNEISLKKWNTIDGKVSDCHKVGNLLLFVLAKLQIKDELDNECELLELLLNNYGISSNISLLIDYLFSEKANINDAIEIASNVVIDPFKASFKLKDVKEINIETRIEEKKLLIRAQELSNNTILYKESIKTLNFDHFKYLIHSEASYGLEGILGKLIFNQHSLPKEWFEYSLNYVNKQLITNTESLFLPIGKNKLSPYFNNGNAGLIKFLIHVDHVKYEELILKLAQGLKFEFAQFPSYNFGMLGIADALLDVYQLYSKDEYLEFIEKLLLNSSFFLRFNRIKLSDFYPVWKRYMEVII
ncbi:class III lanthionine synthetase LanKC N-terminal domain-containing protein [Streptococcus castoreus]|uniref:class III lanthionine synthetase LanKC N-terminal domain-containing protein n=1 Tax=Streptococcus castoreus TaxID=254786 RepID=UPI0003F91879|nr:hypothetical protein [Streptococcus castoreus]